MTNEEFARERADIIRIGNLAVQEAQEENLRNGIPNVYSKNGKIYYQLPNLEITSEDPFLDSEKWKKRA